MSLGTINELFDRLVARNARRVMLYRQAVDWVPISSHELYCHTVGVSRALKSWDIRKGDRVAILSENRPEWAIADFATMRVGAAVVPIYPTTTDEQASYILRDSGTRIIFVSSRQQLEKILAIRERTVLDQIVVMDHVETTQAAHMGQLMHSGMESDSEMDSLAHEVAPHDLATLIYTSGTTGIPKGVMLTHDNMTSNVQCSLHGFSLPPDSLYISFLPLSHVTARHVDYAMFFHGVVPAYCPHIEHLPRALREIRPDIFVGVPRVYEKIRLQVEQAAASGVRRKVLNWALATGKTYRDQILAGETPTARSWRVADRLVFSKIRQGMGGRVRLHISGGAPLGRDLAAWYADVGIRIHEGYGLTETSPVIAVNTPVAHRLGTVGRTLSNLEVRIADDGEILVKGPSVFRGYWNKPEETSVAFDDGFFKTGDIGNLDSDGFLSVTDRKKDLIKTSGGKFLAPQPIERALTANALLAEAVVIGEKRKFPSVLIIPYFPLLEDWARQNEVSFTCRKDLITHPRVVALYEGIVDDLNRGLARFEKLKKIMLVDEEFSVSDGTLTPSMKVRRRAIEQRFQTLIDHLYEEAEVVAVGQSRSE
jgi:long-chain acyl-CoA synthetase